MDNSAFRAFATERTDEKKEAAAAPAVSEEDRAAKRAKQQAGYERRMAIQKRREDALAEESRYTDRAAERRKEENRQDRDQGGGERKHWMEIEAEEAARGEAEQERAQDGPTFAQLGEREDLAAQQHRVSIEQSKYLGGDIEHTHLVKGLDFALLNKIRSENTHADVERTKKGKEDEAKRVARKQQFEASAASAAAKAARTASYMGGASGISKPAAAASGANAVGGGDKVHFASEMGRGVHRVLFGDPHRPNRPLREGRLLLAFDTSAAAPALPSTIVRGDGELEVAAAGEELDECELPDGLLARLSRLSAKLNGGAAKADKKARKERHASAGGILGAAVAHDPFDGALGTPPPIFKLVPLPRTGGESDDEDAADGSSKSRWGGMPGAPPAAAAMAASKPEASAATKSTPAASAPPLSFALKVGSKVAAKPAAPPAQPAVKVPSTAVDDDLDDIFGGVGSDYKCEPSKQQLARAAADRADARALKGEKSAAVDDDAVAEAPPLAWDGDDDDDGGGMAGAAVGGSSGAGAAANSMVKSLLRKAKADRKDPTGQSALEVVEEEDDVDDMALLKASKTKAAGAQAPTTVGQDVAMSGADGYGELLPDTFEGYGNALQIGPDEDDERLLVRAKEKEEEVADGAEGGKGGKGGKGGGRKAGKKGKADVEALEAAKHEAKMDRELVQIEKLMEERRIKRQKRDEGGGEGED